MPREPNEFRETTNERDVKIDDLMSNLGYQELKRGSCFVSVASKAVQTFVVQLAGQASYLPTARSVAGGAYGAVPESTEFGPEGGQELVDQTVELINSLWNEPEKNSGTP